MGINREKHKKSYGYSSKLLSIEPNNLIGSWGQICNNPLVTRVWEQILFKDNNFVPPNYLFLFIFCVILVLYLLLCVLFPTTFSQIYHLYYFYYASITICYINSCEKYQYISKQLHILIVFNDLQLILDKVPFSSKYTNSSE